MYQPIYVANTIIHIAKKQKIKLTETKLQSLMYLLYAEYMRTTYKKLYPARFYPGTNGPTIQSISNMLQKYRDKPIKKLIRDPMGKKKMANIDMMTTNNPEFIRAFHDVWSMYAKQTDDQLTRQLTRFTSAWYITKLKHTYFIRNTDILSEAKYLKQKNKQHSNF